MDSRSFLEHHHDHRTAAESDRARYLTEVLRRAGVRGDDWVSEAVVGSSRATVAVADRAAALAYAGATAHAPRSIIVDCWHPNIGRYHAVLEAHGVRGYDRSRFEDDYRLSVLWHITTPVWQAANNIPPIIWWNNLERIMLAVDDLGCRELLR